ncbi:MAG: hypothetical protein ACTSO9_00045 [Candidatus Helarchaeota archaeon]
MARIKNKDKYAGKYIVKRKKSIEEIEKSKEEEITAKFYWTRAIFGAVSVLLGRVVFGLVGWNLFYWLLGWLFGFPWVMSFLIFRIPYEKGKWDWKMIMKTGIGIFFFMFMVIGTLVHTFMVMSRFEPLLQLFY